MTPNTTGNQPGPKVIAREETPKYILLVELNTDETECAVTCHKKNPPITLKAEELFTIITQAGIKKEFISIDTVNTFCVDLRDGKDPGRTVVARGYRPTPGPDGRIEIHVSTTTDEAHYIIDEQGRIDYRSRHAFANVSPGQKVAVIIPRQNYCSSCIHAIPVSARAHTNNHVPARTRQREALHAFTSTLYCHRQEIRRQDSLY